LKDPLLELVENIIVVSIKWLFGLQFNKLAKECYFGLWGNESLPPLVVGHICSLSLAHQWPFD